MNMGNEALYKPDIPYRDTKGRLHFKPPEWGDDIYIWWSFKKHVLSSGHIKEYKYFNFSKGGKREQYYCRPGEHYPEKFCARHAWDFMNTFTFFIGSLAFWQKIMYKPKKEKKRRKRGRPQAFYTGLYDLLETAGFGTNGSQIVIKYKKFLTLDAAAFRFSLLSDADRAVIGDAETLLNLCKEAYSLLKSRNRLRVATSYEKCFYDNVAAKTNGVKRCVESLREALAA